MKWTGIALGALLGLIFAAAIILYFMGASRLERTWDIKVSPVDVPDDEATIARGRHLAEAVTLCHACHGENLGGDVLFDEPMMATLYASNLTSGRGGVGRSYNRDDYIRAIRHGVNRDGRGLLIMHSDAYNHLGERDLSALIAYLESVPPVDNEIPRMTAAPLGKIFVALGLFDTEAMPLIPAQVIDHTMAVPDAPTPAVTVEYGRYLVTIGLCSMCHGPDLRGAPPIEEGAPPGPNLHAYGTESGWPEEQFMITIRTGVSPYGKPLDPEVMPWEVYARMTDDELMAIRTYIVSLGGNHNP
jgi:mono/diheme cytochrome c family protein